MGLFSSIGGIVGDVFGGITGADEAAKAAQKASGQQLAWQQKGADILEGEYDFLKGFRDPALQIVSDYYMGDQQGMVDSVQSSPFYKSMIEQGRQGVGASLSATGGLRGGMGPTSFYQQDQKTLQNLTNQRLAGLSGLGSMDVGGTNLANIYGNMGATQAAGTTAAAQARQAGIGQGLGALTGGLSLAGNLGWNPFGGNI